MSPTMRNSIVKDKKSIVDGKEMSDQPHLNIDVAIVSQVVGKHRQGESPSMRHQDAHNKWQNQKKNTINERKRSANIEEVQTL